MANAAAFPKKLAKAAFRRIGLAVDYLKYSRRIRPYAAMLPKHTSSAQDSLLIVSGNGMNIMWGQLWPMLSLPIRLRGYRGLVLTQKRQRFLNSYFKLMRLELIYLDDYPSSATIPASISKEVESARTLEDFSRIAYNGAPVGQIALSTYSRNFGTGHIDLSDVKAREYVREWIGRVCSTMEQAQRVFIEYRVKMLFFTEVFMEEFGAFYYAALNANLNIIRFAGTVRDDAFIMQHLSKKNDRIHHSSIDKTTWAQIKQRTDDDVIDAELAQNFSDRYGKKWHKSNRNHANTEMLEVASARELLGIAPGRKVAVIYSHILYDTLFFFGTDLFKDYAQWLVETTRAAINNPNVDWLVKVHPSNIWRGEIDTLLKGRYEEERLLAREFGELPPHVRIVGADTKINPYTWFQLADYGVTVRGTSGLEMAALGKTVITAGTGRYEGNGFTVDPVTAREYFDVLSRIHTWPAPSPAQVKLAKRYAHAIFMLKPFTVTSLSAHKRFGCTKVYASDDMIFLPTPPVEGGVQDDLKRFGDWAFEADKADLLKAWDAPVYETPIRERKYRSS